MAKPSNRTDGRTYLDKNFTKEKLIDRVLMQEAQLMELEEKYKKTVSELVESRKALNGVKRKLDRLNTDEELLKKILEFRARSYSTSAIVKKLELEGFDTNLLQVKDLLTADLSLDMEAYYSACKAKYIESISINTNYYKQSSIDEFQRLIDSAYEDLENSEPEDIKLRDGLRNSIGGLIAKRDSLMKNIDETKEVDLEDELADESTKEWAEESESAIVNLSYIMGVKLGGG
ncbi:MAG: hypothetical protein ACRCZ0_11550 [Cetobacterium sp.]